MRNLSGFYCHEPPIIRHGGIKVKRKQLWVALTTSLTLAVFAPVIGASETAGDSKHHEHDSMPVTHKEAQPDTEAKQPLTIEAGDISIQFGGFAQADWIQDFDYVGNDSQFKVNSIPVPPDPNASLGGSANLQAKATRFSVDVRSLGGMAEGLRVYVEGDFFGSGNSFRMRHGYGEFRGLLAGQTWSTFQDISARPFTLDYEGPDSEIFVRQAMIRYTAKPSNALQWSVAIEDPESEVNVLDDISGSGRTEVPDLTGNINFSGARGHVQLGGLVRQVRFEASDGSLDVDTTGWGLNLSGKTPLGSSTALMGQIAYGSGIGRYVESLGGQNADAVLRPDGSLEALDVWAAVIGLEQKWTDRWSSSLAGAYTDLENDPAQAETAIHQTASVHGNLVYTAGPFLGGVELMWGERENNDGSTGDAFRVQTTIKYSFR
jgi:hypothetical protein